MDEQGFSVSRPTIIYDGDCRFCIARIGQLQRWDTERQFNYMRRQDPESEKLFPQIAGIQLDDGVLLVMPDGRVQIAMDAVFEITSRLPRTRGVAWLYHLPVLKQVSRVAYRLIAMNRRRLGRTCSAETCSLSGKPR